MNIVIGKDFDLLRHRTVNAYGAKNVEHSNKTKNM